MSFALFKELTHSSCYIQVEVLQKKGLMKLGLALLYYQLACYFF